MMAIYWVITMILLLETYTQAHNLNSFDTLVLFLLHDCHHHHRRRCHCHNCVLQSIQWSLHALIKNFLLSWNPKVHKN